MTKNPSQRRSGVILPNTVERLFYSLDIQLLMAHRIRLGNTWNYRLMSPFWRIYVHDRVGAHLLVDGKRTSIEPDTIVIIPAWLSFETSVETTVHQHVIHFEFRGLSPTRQRRLLNSIVTIELAGSARENFSTWVEHLPNRNIAATAKAAAFMHDVLSRLAEVCLDFRGLRAEQHINTILEPALHLIDTAPQGSLKNADLAKRCGLSVDHFIRLFKEATGQSPARYRLELRLTNAARLLTNTPKSIEQIADETGFADRFHFSKAFKKYFETAPGHYRSSHELV